MACSFRSSLPSLSSLGLILLSQVACHPTQSSYGPLNSDPFADLAWKYKEYFQLISDANTPQIVYYAPLEGGISTESGVSKISLRDTPQGIRVAGTFKTGGFDKILKVMREDFLARGMRLAPAPVKSSQADYLLAAKRLAGGVFDVQCDPNGQIRSCKVWDEKLGAYRDTLSDIRRFQATLPSASSVADRMYFHFELDSSNRETVEGFLRQGSDWDSLFIAKVDWVFHFQEPSLRTEVSLDWPRMIAEARDIIRKEGGFLSADALSEWFVSLGQKEDAPYRLVEGQDDQLGLLFAHLLRPKLFGEILDHRQTGHSSVYTLRVMPELEEKRIETIGLDLPSKNLQSRHFQTFYRIDCLQGAIGEKLVPAPASEYCPEQ